MKKIILIIGIFLFVHPTFSQWSMVSQIPSNILSLFFNSADTGYVGGYIGPNIYKTTNGGMNFFTSYIGFSNGYINDMYFLNAQTGFADCLVGGNGRIIKTTNAGNNWVSVANGFQQLHSIFFSSVSTGYSCGSAQIVKSTDGGNSWFTLSNPFSGYQLGVYFINDNTGCVCGGNLLGKTTNGGSSWIQVYNSGPFYLEEIILTDANTGYACGTTGVVIKSTNGGLNWTQQNSGTPNWLHDMYMINNNTGWACGREGTIIRTTNGGINWTLQSTGVSDLLRQLHMVNSNTGYAVSDGGLILKTTNGGVIGIEPIGNEIPKAFSLSQNYQNPFNPTTIIEFALPKAGNVLLKVFDESGKEILSLISEYISAGNYKYELDMSEYSSGIYFYRIESNDFADTKKMVLVK